MHPRHVTYDFYIKFIHYHIKINAPSLLLEVLQHPISGYKVPYKVERVHLGEQVDASKLQVSTPS